MLSADPFYRDDYAGAREGFLAAARRAGARLERLPLEARGPDGQALGIDIAWLGADSPRRLVLHSSGVHGVEGFAGSAVQRAILAAPPALAADQALVFAHVLNPYGMAWLRRANEHNVDLNRNCLTDDGGWRGAPAGYRTLDPLLNPPSPPRPDGFYLRAVAAVLRYGFGTVRQAVAGGQYDYPRGLFYGGAQLEEGPSRYRDWIRAHLGGVEALAAIDVHTGLGPWGHGSQFEESAGRPGAESAGYAVRGGMIAAVRAWLPGARVRAVTQEFGTYSSLRVLHALREENRWHFYGRADLAHPSKSRLRAALCPASPAWRRAVLTQGIELAARACTWRVDEIPPAAGENRPAAGGGA
ncbi:MAG TPA: DUF2817 domain-containing protein [Gammaproteobacteria bacterium]|nr:DUF2817 domain-containing protein [Gammaproteobacteria bacterium]